MGLGFVSFNAWKRDDVRVRHFNGGRREGCLHTHLFPATVNDFHHIPKGARERGNESRILRSFGSEEKKKKAQMVLRGGGAERRNQEGGSGSRKRAKKVEGVPESSRIERTTVSQTWK